MKKGIYFAVITAVISGFSIFASKIFVSGMDPVIFTTLKNIFVAIVLSALIVKSTTRESFKNISKGDWIKLLSIGIIGGGIPFALFFTGLKIASAPTAAIIHKTLFIWIAILALPILHEKLNKTQILGYIAILTGALWVSGPQIPKLGIGELMIASATALWAIENIIAKKVLKNVSSEIVSFMRMSVGSLVLFAIVIYQGNISLLTQLSNTQYLAILVSGALLVGYVLSWYKALSLAPATTVSSILVLSTPITSILTAIFISHSYPHTELISGILIIFGAALTANLAKNWSKAFITA